MNMPTLLDGISPIPAMIGLLASGQLLTLASKDYIIEAEGSRSVSLSKILEGCWKTFRYPGVLFRGSVIGIIIGAVPGVGSSLGNLIAYAETKRTAKDSASFGHGNPKGVIAAESAVASAEGGSMATMLALGIPGGGATAILLAAFMMHNIVPGRASSRPEGHGLRDHPEQHRSGDRALSLASASSTSRATSCACAPATSCRRFW
jgi:putative tricarboxylic transport membrane protein